MKQTSNQPVDHLRAFSFSSSHKDHYGQSPSRQSNTIEIMQGVNSVGRIFLDWVSAILQCMASRRFDLRFSQHYFSLRILSEKFFSRCVMRYQGKVSNWKDDQGFGFVTQNGGSERAFVHIKAFSSRSRRPVEGDLITFEVQKDAKNRLTAANIRFVGEKAPAASSSNSLSFGSLFTIGFSLFLIANVLVGLLPYQIILVYLASSAITFIAYALDKSAAQKNLWRIQESTLHLFGLIGGWPGALLAQKVLRHKSIKREFQNVFRFSVVLNCLALGWLMTEGGSTFLKSL